MVGEEPKKAVWEAGSAFSTHIRSTLRNQGGEVVGDFHGVIQYRQKYAHSKPTAIPVQPTEQMRKEVASLLAAGMKDDDLGIVPFTRPSERVCYVTFVGIQKLYRAQGALGDLFDKILPLLRKAGVTYVVGKYEGFTVQEKYGEDTRVPIVYERLGERLADGMYWIPIEKIERFYHYWKSRGSTSTQS